MDPMHDAMKRKMGSMKGPNHPLEDAQAAAPEIDLSKIDPALLKAIVEKLQTGGMEEIQEAGAPQAPGAGLDPNGVKPGSDQAPIREAAVSAIADGGGHAAGSLHARAADGAKGHLANFKKK